MTRPALPLADARAFAGAGRRTAAAFVVLALAAAAAVVLVYLALSPARQTAAPVVGGGTVPVIDVSGSISPAGYRLVRQTLQRLAGGGGRVGLVLFSDAAEQALPPGTPAAELRAFVRALEPASGQLVAATASAVQTNPWDATFSRGTRISVGLAVARKMLDRAGGGHVILLSDLLDDASDADALRHELVGYARDPRVRLQIVRLPGAGAPYLKPYQQLIGRRAVGVDAPAAASDPPAGRRAPSLWIALLVGVVAAAFAAAELAAAPLRWRQAP